MKKVIIALASICTTSFLVSCNSNGLKKTESGLPYQFLHDEKGDQHPQLDDIVVMHFKTNIGDSVIFSTYEMNNNEPLEIPLSESKFKGDLPDGIKLMTPGDSVKFYVPLDSIIATGAQKLPWMKEGDTIVYTIKLEKIKTKDDIKKEQEEMMATLENKMVEDDATLQTYFKDKGINATKSNSGIYYTINKDGNGPKVEAGKTVSMFYTGKTLDGNIFDSNVGEGGQALTFQAGAGQMIEGMDAGIMELKKGSKATLYIPSPLAYGPNSPTPAIPAFSILIFDVEISDVK